MLYTWEYLNTTEEAMKRIADGDREELQSFFDQNIKLFLYMARKYIKLHDLDYDELDGLLNQLYVDIPNLRTDSAYTFLTEVTYRSFTWYQYGGYTQRKADGLYVAKYPEDVYNETFSLNDVLYDDAEIGDFIQAPTEDQPEEALCHKTEKTPLTADEVIELLGDLCGEKEKHVLKLFMNGVSFTEVSAELGRGYTCIQNQLFKKLKRRYIEVLERLQASDRSEAWKYAGRTPYDLDMVLEAYEKRRAKAKEYEKRREAEREAWRKANQAHINAQVRERRKAATMARSAILSPARSEDRERRANATAAV